MGQTIRVNERPYTVIGITPRGFTGTMSVVGPELFFPLGVFHTLATEFLDASARSLQRADAYNLFLVGRLKDGVTLDAANARTRAVRPEPGSQLPGRARTPRAVTRAAAEIRHQHDAVERKRDSAPSAS